MTKNSVEPIRVLITDDHEVVRTGLRAFMQIELDIEVVGEAANGREAVALVKRLQPDVVLMDLVMPEMSGTEAIREITQNSLEKSSEDGSEENIPKTRIIAVTSFSDEDKVFPAIKAGAMGYVLKDTPPQALVQAIRQVHCGESSLDPTIAVKLLREFSRPKTADPQPEKLTEREIEVLKLVAQGLSNQEIAEALVVTEKTVRNHVVRILGKLHLANRTQAALYALREGFASLHAP